MQIEIEAWLRRNNVPYYMPAVLPAEFYCDASHPTSRGYAELAKQLQSLLTSLRLGASQR